MKEAIVIGGNGFLGTYIIEELFSINYNIIVFDKFLKKNKKYKQVTGKKILLSNFNPDIIFFCAGNYANSYKELLEINSLLYEIVLTYKNSKIVYISSVNVYGNQSNIIEENSSYNNPNIYGQSKIAGEFIVKSHPKYSIVRLTYLYGPNLSNKSFLPNIVKSAKTEGVINIYGEGERMQDYLYVGDAAKIIIKAAMINNNDIYLGASGKSISNKKVAELVSKYTGAKINYDKEETGNSVFYNPIKTFKKLNWTNGTSFEEGIKKMIL